MPITNAPPPERPAEERKVLCRADHDAFISPFWINPVKGATKELEESVAAHLCSAGCVTILKVEPETEKKSGSSAQVDRPSKPRTSRSSGKKSTKR